MKRGIVVLLGWVLGGCSTEPPSGGPSPSTTAPTTTPVPVATTSASASTSAAATRTPSVEVEGTSGDAKVRYVTAVSWKIRDAAYVVTLSTKPRDCDALPYVPNRDRSAFDKDRLDILITEQVGPPSGPRWALKHVEPLYGLSGKLDATIEGEPDRGVAAAIDLDFYEKEGPTVKVKGRFVAKPCGSVPPWPSAKVEPRPQPDLELVVAGRKVEVRGAKVIEFGGAAAPTLVLDADPLSCDGGEATSSFGIRWSPKSALRPDSDDPSVELYGDRAPRPAYDFKGKASTRITNERSEAPTATLDWDFTQDGVPVTAKGTVHAIHCHDASFDGAPRGP